MKKVLVLFFLSIVSTSIFAVDLAGGWRNYTPDNNEIAERNQSVTFSFSTKSEELRDLKRWYFYRGFTIGEYSEGYFTIDEKKGEIKIFKYQDRWENYIKNNDLRPHRWTRWYEAEWSLLNNFWLMFFLAPIILILLVFYFRLIYISIKQEGFNLSKPFSMLAFIIPLSIVIFILLDMYPSSF